MVLKIPNLKNSKGYSLVYMLVYLAILMVLISVVVLSISPVESRQRARDEKRLSDIVLLETAINSYLLDNGEYPDAIDTLRTSNTLPFGSPGPLYDVSGNGWIDANLSAYDNTLPTDPINDATYNYQFQHNGSDYELNAILEYYTNYASDDGGSSSTVYEVGTDLTIIM